LLSLLYKNTVDAIYVYGKNLEVIILGFDCCNPMEKQFEVCINLHDCSWRMMPMKKCLVCHMKLTELVAQF